MRRPGLPTPLGHHSTVLVSTEFYSLAITGHAGLRMHWFVAAISFPVIFRPTPSHLNSFARAGYLLSIPYCLRTTRECLPHEACTHPTRLEPRFCPLSIGGYSPPGTLLVSLQRGVSVRFTNGTAFLIAVNGGRLMVPRPCTPHASTPTLRTRY